MLVGLTWFNTAFIRQLSPHRVGPQKKQEAERQIQSLLAREMIEPTSGA